MVAYSLFGMILWIWPQPPAFFHCFYFFALDRSFVFLWWKGGGLLWHSMLKSMEEQGSSCWLAPASPQLSWVLYHDSASSHLSSLAISSINKHSWPSYSIDHLPVTIVQWSTDSAANYLDGYLPAHISCFAFGSLSLGGWVSDCFCHRRCSSCRHFDHYWGLGRIPTPTPWHSNHSIA